MCYLARILVRNTTAEVTQTQCSRPSFLRAGQVPIRAGQPAIYDFALVMTDSTARKLRTIG